MSNLTSETYVWHNLRMQPKDTEKAPEDDKESAPEEQPPKEIGGRDGPDPTRYGDWEKAGRCIDF